MLTREVSDLLGAADATHPGLEVLVDQQCLRAGVEWPAQLHAMMAYANAGLLLFTPAAMRRPDWIRKEANILTWRRALDPSFKLFYAFLDPAIEGALSSNGFDPANLGLVQRLKATDAAGIAAEVRREMPLRALPRTPLEELASYLGAHLKLDAAALAEVAESIDAPPIPWLPDPVRVGVNRVAARLLSGRLGRIGTTSALINDLKARGIQAESLKIVMRWVAPYWLSPEAVGRLAAVICDLWEKRGPGVALINGNVVLRYTAKMFVFKTRPFEFQCRVVEMESGTSDPGVEYYTGAICNWLREEDRRGAPEEREFGSLDDAGIVAKLKRGKPYLFVPMRAPDRATLAELRKRFPQVVFLLWTGPDLEPLYDGGAVLIEPQVDGEQEGREADEWWTAQRSLRG